MKNTNVSIGDLYTLVGLSQISVAESNAYDKGEGDLYHTPVELKKQPVNPNSLGLGYKGFPLYSAATQCGVTFRSI